MQGSKMFFTLKKAQEKFTKWGGRELRGINPITADFSALLWESRRDNFIAALLINDVAYWLDGDPTLEQLRELNGDRPISFWEFPMKHFQEEFDLDNFR